MEENTEQVVDPYRKYVDNKQFMFAEISSIVLSAVLLSPNFNFEDFKDTVAAVIAAAIEYYIEDGSPDIIKIYGESEK